MTLAEQWKSKKPFTFDSMEAYLDMVQAHDPNGYFKLIDNDPFIIFSDGSKHCMRTAQ